MGQCRQSCHEGTKSLTASIHPIDLDYKGIPGAIGAFLVEGPDGHVLIESGPASTLDRLIEALATHGLEPGDLDACLVTHIHLDHAGAAGHLAARGVPIYVHAFGAKHLVDPSKLLTSAKRIYGAAMDDLWGETIPIPESHALPVNGGQVINAGGIEFTAVETPGHARHHHVFMLDIGSEIVCFSGDAAAMLIPGTDFISIPTPPPEFDLPAWLETIALLKEGPWKRLFLTHGGVVETASDHLDRLACGLAAQVSWFEGWKKEGLEAAGQAQAYRERLLAEAVSLGVDESIFDDFVSPQLLGMNIMGIQRWLEQQETAIGG